MRHRDFMNRLLKAMVDDPCLLLSSDRTDAYHVQMRKLNAEHMARMRAAQGEGILAHLGCDKS